MDCYLLLKYFTRRVTLIMQVLGLGSTFFHLNSVTILQKISESWKFIYTDIAGQCRWRVILEAFGEGDVNSLSVERECCDVCEEQ